MIIGLTGRAGVGKDSFADALGLPKIGFADALYQEVSEAFGVPVAFLRDRKQKERQAFGLSMAQCEDIDFVSCIQQIDRNLFTPRSPRQILQWWGTEYRRAQDENYWIDKARQRIKPDDWVVLTDVRFENENALIQELGGKLVKILRAGIGAVNGHVSEEFWTHAKADFVIHNSDSMQALAGQAHLLLETLRKS